MAHLETEAAPDHYLVSNVGPTKWHLAKRRIRVWDKRPGDRSDTYYVPACGVSLGSPFGQTVSYPDTATTRLVVEGFEAADEDVCKRCLKAYQKEQAK